MSSFAQLCMNFKPGFHKIQGSLAMQGSHNFVTSDHSVQIETVLFSLLAIAVLPVILVFEIENFLSLGSQ